MSSPKVNPYYKNYLKKDGNFVKVVSEFYLEDLVTDYLVNSHLLIRNKPWDILPQEYYVKLTSIAISKGNAADVQFLIDSGVDILYPSAEGTLLEQAKRKNVKEVTDIVEQEVNKACAILLDEIPDYINRNEEMNEIQRFNETFDVIKPKIVKSIERFACAGGKGGEDPVIAWMIGYSSARRPEILDFLLSLKNTTAQDKSEILAYSIHSLEAVKYWLDKGADINAKIDFWQSLLHKAMPMRGYETKENVELIQFLLENGADYTIKKWNMDALEDARNSGHQGIVKAIQEFIMKKDGISPIDDLSIKIEAEEPKVNNETNVLIKVNGFCHRVSEDQISALEQLLGNKINISDAFIEDCHSKIIGESIE